MPTLRRWCLIFCYALFAAASAVAGEPWTDIEQRLTPEQRHATGLDTLTPTQLQLLNQLLREEQHKVVAAEVREATANASKPAAAAPPVDRTGGASLIGLSEGPIKTRLKGRVTSWEPGTEFDLENGQRWKVLKGSATLRKPLDSPEVVLVPGVAGRWFLQIDEDMPKPRVYRID
jgi:hypothetical protein